MIPCFHYSGSFSPQECNELIKYALLIPPCVARVGSEHGDIEHEMRTSELRWLSYHDQSLTEFYSRIQRLYVDAQVSAFGMRDMYGNKEYQFTTYRGLNGGRYDFHQDSGTSYVGADRRLSMVMLLSDPSEFTGGQFEMQPRALPHVLAKQGDVLFFRSEILHRVLQVTSGVRHSLVTWFYGARN